MREEIRLGNEALAQNDIEAAKQHFQHLLDTGGTLMQERIAVNRLRDIQAQQEAQRKPPSAKPRTRRKASGGTTRAQRDELARRPAVRPPAKPVVVINRY
jgi:hypothetical protein